MDPFDSPLSAQEFLLIKIHEAAAREGVSFTSFETRLLHDYDGVSDEELEQYEEKGGDLAAKVLPLLSKIETETKRESGSRGLREHRRAIKLAKKIPNYLGGILGYGETGKSTPLDNLLYVLIGLSVVAVAILFAEYGDELSHWYGNTEFGKHYYPAAQEFLEQHFPELFITFVATVLFFGWLLPWFQARRARNYPDLDEPE